MKVSTRILIFILFAAVLTVGIKQIFFSSQCQQACQTAIALSEQSTYEKFKLSPALLHFPDIDLISHEQNKIQLKTLIESDKDLFIQFIFTTCPTICPILTTNFYDFQEFANKANEAILMASISIDPEYDNPSRLDTYANAFNARKFWKFYTGSKNDIDKLQATLKNYQSNKMYHRPVTYYRNAKTNTWIVYEGFISGQLLWDDYKKDIIALR